MRRRIQAFGFTEEESNQIKDVLLTADLYGIESHGMQRMVRYHKGIEKGTIHPQAKPEIVFETPISAVIDGHNGMGQLISVYAMKKAIEKAKKTGVGIVTVRESNHFGIAGYYAKMACDEDFWEWPVQIQRLLWFLRLAKKPCLDQTQSQ